MRFFAPHEIALMFGIHEPFKMSHDIQSNFLAVGNAVSTYHAGIVLAKILETILDTSPSPGMIVKHMLESRSTIDNSTIETFHDVTIISRACDDDQNPHEPIDIEPTQDFIPEINIGLCANDGMHSITCEGHANLEQVCESFPISMTGRKFYRVGTSMHQIDRTYEISRQGIRIHAIDEDVPVDMIMIREKVMQLIDDSKPSILVIFKFSNRPFFQVALPKETSMDLLLHFTEFGYTHGFLQSEYRLTSRATTIDHRMTIHDYMVKGSVRFDIHPSVRGGGGGKKDQMHQAAAETITKLFVTKGFSVATAQQKAQFILQKIGLQSTHNACQEGDDKSVWKALLVEADKRGIQLITQSDHMSRSASLIQNHVRKRITKKEPTVPKSADLKLQPGWFFNQDKTSASLISAVGPALTGVALQDADQVAHLLNSEATLSTDELAVVIPWSPSWDFKHGTLIQVPVVDKTSGPAIIYTILIQLGEKPVVFGQAVTKMEKEDVTTVIFMVRREDFDDKAWNEFLKNPVKSTLSRFDEQHVKDGIVRVWGRAFFHQRAKSKPEQASSFSFMSVVRDTTLNKLMMESGLNHVYLKPRQDGSNIDHRYGIIWLPNRLSAETSIAKLPQHKGIVFTEKGFGIRLLIGDLEAGHKVIFPSQPFQKTLQIKYVYKLSPCPKGITEEAIKNWAVSLSWKCKPLRRLGDRAWVIGSEEPKPLTFAEMEGTPVLVQELKQNRTSVESIVLAGKLQTSDRAASSSDPAVDQFKGIDPWAAYVPTRQQSGQGNQTAAPRALTGPVQTCLNEQNARIDSLEKKIESIQKDQKTTDGLLKQQAQETKQKFTFLEKSIKDDFRSMNEQFTQTLGSALQQQNNTLMDQLKKMFRDQSEQLEHKRKANESPQKPGMEEDDF